MPTRAAFCRLALAATLLAALPAAADAQNRRAEIYTGILSATALGGYDPVAYFADGRPLQGRRDISYSWKGATWRFANEKNQAAFIANPQAYAPQYGGYCAWAVAEGYTAKGDPQHWRIVDGKLYLNYDARVHANWAKDVPGNVSRGDRNWPNVLGK